MALIFLKPTWLMLLTPSRPCLAHCRQTLYRFTAVINGRVNIVSQLGFLRLEADFGNIMSCSLALLGLWLEVTKKCFDAPSETPPWLMYPIRCCLVPLSHTHNAFKERERPFFFVYFYFFYWGGHLSLCIYLASDACVHLIDTDVLTAFSSRRKSRWHKTILTPCDVSM